MAARRLHRRNDANPRVSARYAGVVVRLRREALRLSWELRYLAGPSPTRPPSDWRDAAACKPAGWDWFALDPRDAVKVCDACPVRLACLHEARTIDNGLSVQHISDVAGGLMASRRAALQRQLRAEPDDTEGCP